ncbi:3-oxoacyl-[acyl-carrier-protein] reductase [Bacillus cereus group sp. TH152-1LC]|uniref:3-oxoacyl-[acyl-carrier-protein] reductase n=1 Tax=Bacillus cereus group sp. TH152-1LC TaxID=3018060 RepID=UPI0022E47F55|nr:3-oxoacyl-[acyl-carrier-protein] reductase [Bacillus cereus group sp. TH152-1LC]MDA1674972.1 3-oxoacyl-[acyl-carrier-protein] reductase [Bacillus cereus group sp. TH152-1LC]
MKLEHKVAIVTGASRGIGKAIALELARNGLDVVINYSGNEEAAKNVAKEVEKLGRKALVIKANVAVVSEVEEMFKETISAFGKVDILVNNAGITRDNLMMRMKEEEWDAVINTNLKGVYNCMKAATRPMMRQKSGRIVNISSVVGILGNPGQVNYVAAKAGVIGITKTMAKELASKGITVNAVAPGFIETDMTDELSEGVREGLLKQIPLNKLGQPEDIAKVVRFLVSEDAQYMTGQTISVDGGMAM